MATNEVTNAETLLAFAQGKEQKAATELQDAKSAKARIDDEIALTSNAIAAMTRLKFHKDDIALLVALREAEKADAAALATRISACDKELAAAKAAVAMAAKHVQIQQQKAAGQAYAG